MDNFSVTTVINDKYDFFKKSFGWQCLKYDLKFDEDIYQDTLLNCYTKFATKTASTLSLFVDYLWKSFRQNTLRDLKYQRNLMKNEQLNENMDMIDENEYNKEIDKFYNTVINDISLTFGDDLCEKFKLHYENNKEYKELSNNYYLNEKQLHEKFRTIRNYIKNKYKTLPWKQ